MSRRNRADLEGVETSPDGRYIRFDEKLGSGAYKCVWLAYDTDLGIEVAWNTVDLKRLPEKEKIRLKSETDILKNLNHNCIINFYNSWENPDLEQVIFTTEIVTSGTLKQYVSRFKPIKLKVIKKWCRQILQGLCYLHSKNPPIIHRDLKCDNIFINGSTGDIRIGDLGLSTMRNATHAASVLGTPEFMAPELYDEWYTEKVDVYAFGMVVLEMISNEYPYAECTNTAQIFKKVSAGIRPESLNRLQSSATREFIELCLAKSNVRLAAEDLAKHPFLDPRFVDYRERFPIQYDPILTTTSNAPPLVPVMELAAVAEHSQHSLEQATIKEEEGDQISDSHEVSFLEVILENTVENIARVVLTLDLGNRRKEIKFPFDLDSDTAEAVAIEMVKELGLQQSSVNKLSDGIYTAIKDEKVKWNQIKVQIGQSRVVSAVLENLSVPPQPTATGLTSALLSPSIPGAVNATTHHSVPVLGTNGLAPFSASTASSKPQPSTAAPAGAGIPVLPANTGILTGVTNPAGVLSNVATDAPMIDPFTGAPLQASGAAVHPESSAFPVSEPPPLYPGQNQQQQQATMQSAFSAAPTSTFAGIGDFQGPSGPVPTPAFTSSSSTPSVLPLPTAGGNVFPAPVPGTLPKLAPSTQRTASVPNAPMDLLLVSVSSAPNLQAVGSAVAPPSSFALAFPQGPSPVISAGSFTSTSSAIPFVAQPPSSFQSVTTATTASSFGNVPYLQTSTFSSSPTPPLYPNAAPSGSVPPQTALLTPPQQQQQVPVNALGQSNNAVSQQPGISVPSSQASSLSVLQSTQASMTMPSAQASVSMTSSVSPVSQNPPLPTLQVLPQTAPAASAAARPDFVKDAGRPESAPCSSPTGSQPPIVPSPQVAPRFVKRRSIEELRFPDNSSQDGDSQSASAENSGNAASSKPVKNSPDQALDISNFLSGFDVAQLSPNQLTTLRDLRSQLDDSIRILKTQYAAMYREAVNKYKMEVVDNLTGWGFPIPPLNLKVQGLGSARGNQQLGGAAKSVNPLSRRTRDVISLAHGSSNDLILLDSNSVMGRVTPGPNSNSSLPPSSASSQSPDSSNPDHIYNRLMQPFAPPESISDSNSICSSSSSSNNNNNHNHNSDMKSAAGHNNLLGLVPPPGPGPHWPPKIDPLDPLLWESSSQSPSS